MGLGYGGTLVAKCVLCLPQAVPLKLDLYFLLICTFSVNSCFLCCYFPSPLWRQFGISSCEYYLLTKRDIEYWVFLIHLDGLDIIHVNQINVYVPSCRWSLASLCRPMQNRLDASPGWGYKACAVRLGERGDSEAWCTEQSSGPGLTSYTCGRWGSSWH